MRLIQFILFILVIIVNFGINALFDTPFDDDIFVFIQPAGYAFAIWGPIFLGMIIYSWFQWKSGRVESPHLRNATIAGIFAALASIAFVPLSFTNNQPLIFLNLLWHLIALVLLFIHLRRQLPLEANPNTRWFYLPTQMYLGWVCAATAVSLALALKSLGIDPGAETEIIITAIVVVALIVVGLFLAFQRGKIATLTIVWALVALVVKNGEYLPIKWSAIAGIIILSGTVLFKTIKGEQLSF